jgi:signal transduction histidine kinase
MIQPAMRGCFAWNAGYRHMEKRPRKTIRTAKKPVKKASPLQDNERFRSNLLSIISHELNTPLTSIINATAMLEERFPLEKEFVPMLRRNAERLRKTIENLIDISRVDAGSLRVRLGEVNLANFLLARKESLKEPLARQSFQIQLELEEDIPNVCGDPKRLSHVFDALVLNAVKFSHRSLLKEGEQATVLVSLEMKSASELPSGLFSSKLRKTGMYLVVSVQSSLPSIGEGPDHFEQLFEPFTPWRDADTRQREGLGVELAIAKEILLAHEGFIWANIADTKKTEGLKFLFALPLLSRLDELDLVVNNRLFTSIGALSRMTLLLLRPEPGYVAGKADEQHVALALRKVLFRSSDSTFWIEDAGEFAILMDDCDHEGAVRVAERLLVSLRDHMPQTRFLWAIATGPDEGSNALELLEKARSSWRPSP